MKRKTQIHSLVAWLLTFVMLLSVMPSISFEVSAASVSDKYIYKIEVRNSGVKKGGTDGDVFCVVKTHTYGTQVVKIDSGADDFEKNDQRTYEVPLEVQPWDISEVGLRNMGKDGMHIAWFKFMLPNGQWIHKDVNDWFEKQGDKTYERTYSVMFDVDRSIKTTGNFDSQFGGTLYVDPSTTSGQGKKVMEWDGKVSDQYFSDYNFFAYPGAVNITFEVNGKSYGYGSLRSLSDLGSMAETSTNSDGFINKLTLKTDNILSHMKNNKIYKLTIDSTIDYIYEFDEQSYRRNTFTIIRKGFELGDASAITTAYTPMKDNNFYNSEKAYKTFEIKIPVLSRDNYSASTIAQSLVDNIKNGKSVAKVYYDEVGGNGYVTPKSVRASGSDIYLVCNTPEGYANKGNKGITAVIENAQATYSGELYKLDTDNAYYRSYISTHKIDTKGLEHTVTDENGSPVDLTAGFDTYKKEHKFMLGADERIYTLKNGKPSDGMFSYELYTKDMRTTVPLADYRPGTPTTFVPHTDNGVYTVKAKNSAEGIYNLVISSRDFANNLEKTTVPVYLDNIAPRASYTLNELELVSGTVSNRYTFKIDDVSNTGRLYYVFVEDGNSVPSTEITKPETSGPTETVFGKWGFIDQLNTSAQTVVLDVPENSFFEGRLYWYTVDEAGNNSATEKHTGSKVDANGYFYTDIDVYNVPVECDIIINDSTPGKSEYDISFVTSEHNTVKYRWKGDKTTTPYSTYSADSTPGGATQTTGMNSSVVLDGKYVLEYTVTAPGGATKTYTREFVFDNSYPTVTVTVPDSKITESERVTVKVQDISNITSLKYQLFTASGTAVGEETQLNSGLPVVSDEITVFPEKSGAYKVKFVAEDSNGYVTETESPVFYVRTSAPSLEVSHKGARGYWNEIPLINSQKYYVTVEGYESIVDVDDFDKNQAMFYRFSSDGINYGEWSVVKAEVDGNGLRGYAEDIEAPVALNDGENRIYVQILFAAKDADPNKISADYISSNDESVLIYDIEAPQYKFEIDAGEPTKETVYAKLTYTDNLSAAGNIELGRPNTGTYGVYLSERSVTDETAVYDVEITDNVENAIITVTDEAGNTTEIPVTVDCIDKVAPNLDGAYGNGVTSGERTDYVFRFTVDEVMDDKISLALIEGEGIVRPNSSGTPTVEEFTVEDLTSDMFGPKPENTKNVFDEYARISAVERLNNYENGEAKLRYEITVRGGIEEDIDTPYPSEEDYTDYDAYEAAYSQWEADFAEGLADEYDEPNIYEYINYDAFYGDVEAWENEWAKKNSKSFGLGILAEDALGNVRMQYINDSYSPISVINAPVEIETCYASPYMAHNKAAVFFNTTVPVFVKPSGIEVPSSVAALHDGLINDNDGAEIEAFCEAIVNSVTTYSQSQSITIDSIGEHTVYFADEAGRVFKKTIIVKDDSDYNEDEELQGNICFVSFGNELPAKITLHKVDGSEADISEDTALSSVPKALDFEGGYRYFVVVEAIDTADKWVTFDPDGWDTSYTGYGGYSIADFDAIHLAEKEMIFEVEDTLNTDRLFTVTGEVESDSTSPETVGLVYELSLLDTTGPIVDAAYSTRGYTKDDVIVSINAYDPECAVGETTKSGSETEFVTSTPEEDAVSFGIASIEVSEIYEDYIYEDEYSDLDYTSLDIATSVDISFDKDGYRVVKVTNIYGLSTYYMLEVYGINKEAIEEGTHYNVNYYSDHSGTEEEVDDDGYYKNVTARISITSDGEDREVYIANAINSETSGEAVLTSFSNEHTFVLKDMYGHTVEVPVSFERFDLTGPVVGFEVIDKYKTNTSVRVELNATDLYTSVKDIELFDANGEKIATSLDREEANDGVDTVYYTASVEESGIYTVKATDILGNETLKNFTVSNIDKTKPSVAEMMYTNTEFTTQTVGVKLYYTKPGVVITHAETVQGTSLTPDDVTVDYRDSVIRFHENGSVALEFTDEYGNVGTEIVTVDNINRTPPAIEAEKTVADDLLSVDVSFKLKVGPDGLPVDKMRELSDVYVLHGGVTPVRTYEDENGDLRDEVLDASEVTFTFIENGTYKFYAYDSIGNIQQFEVEITEIDTRAPVITNVALSYKYLDDAGNEVEVQYTITPEGLGYNAVDDIYKATNMDVTATVTTDLGTRFAGSTDEVKTENSIVYTQDGWFNFNLERMNRLMASYGLGIYLIDKEAPVIEEVEDLMFFENPAAGEPYSKDLLKYKAYDVRYDVTTDLTDKVEIDWGGFDPDDITANVFDKNRPYTVTYTVKDSVGNITSVTRKITLVGLFDTMVKVNGLYPGSSGRLEVVGDTAEISLDNFSGKAYARYAKGIHTMGQMKSIGTVLPEEEDGSFIFVTPEDGWYTFYVQTDLRDYFCVNVYFFSK